MSFSSGNKLVIFCVYLLFPQSPQFPSHSPSSEKGVPYSTETQHIHKLRAVLRISIYLSLFFRPLLPAAFQSFSSSWPSKRNSSNRSSKRKRGTSSPKQGRGCQCRNKICCDTVALGSTLRQSLAFDFLQPLDGTKNAAVPSACSWKIT